ncbi:MAG TPA: PA0069 family radical SAM protein [Blastocatellia bacterium]|nr:PA0069 family radical SAM protein [Blastocatellia bacterium]
MSSTIKPEPNRGRGALSSPPNRFFKLTVHRDPEAGIDEISPKTEFLRDSTKTIIAHNDSPDVGFATSVNPYRGCEHGCIYCFARPTHEYLDFSVGLDFETKILVKEDAPQLLRAELSSKKWKPQLLAFSGVTDCYQPIERKLTLTRQCLEVCLDYRNPIIIITKNNLVTRDTDILIEMAKFHCAAVFVSVTTLNPDLARIMEPRASIPERRLAAIETLSAAGIPVGVMVAPVIPGLTDHEIPNIVEAAAKAGAQHAGLTIVRLPYAVKEIFEQWLDEHFPERKDKVLNHLRDMRGGKLNNNNFGERMGGDGPFAEQIESLFRISCRKSGITNPELNLSTDSFRRPDDKQLQLF